MDPVAGSASTEKVTPILPLTMMMTRGKLNILSHSAHLAEVIIQKRKFRQQTKQNQENRKESIDKDNRHAKDQ